MYGFLILIISIPIRSFGLSITASVPDNVRTGDSVSVSLAHSEGDPSDFYLSMYCTNNGKTDDSVSDVANFASDTTEDISIVSLGNCIIRALLHSEPDADTPFAESESFDLRASSPELQSSPTSASTDHMMVIAQMINLALGATSFLGVLGIILYLFLQRTRAKPRNRLNTKPPSNPDPHSPVIIVTPDQRLTFTSPKPLASDREVRHLSLISRRTPDVPTAVQSPGTSDLSLYSTTTNENLTFLSFPLPPAATQSELQEFVARLRREASLRSKLSSEQGQGAGDDRLRKQIYGMRSEIAYLRAELDLAWALGFGDQTAPSTDSGSRRSEESGTLSVHSSNAPQVSSNVIL
ncbi:uncharacterized protein ARMOST_15161 [Armillaria ostoyae]|uniref:Mid2 domain-containing protein n=1 Tax=Armillaria ostoyae TaxID=47428 RepID=A0A284RSK6_ARMOS|nr:uncharacterized protein ARMOST_15161 [Armillaria ostoyae]